MAAPILEVNADHPQPRHVQRAVEILERGGVIAYPTDTYYGLGCDLGSKKAIERLYQLKGRD
ncbi:MAG TPA: Sua5/YciO/YrdC/YwlC family protein, partial [Myxococcaceae bacterium]|nr:Sua5/YciO/YrdC/YwlC family protein [Myxococcaceae bacterium]